LNLQDASLGEMSIPTVPITKTNSSNQLPIAVTAYGAMELKSRAAGSVNDLRNATS